LDKYSLLTVILVIPLIWILSLAVTYVGLWAVLYVTLDLIIFQRKRSVEAVLPDFLLLTAANIRAGMPIDRALWFAVRPRFGVLAKEIEIVAKQTLSGEDLNSALTNFSDKYDSQMLKRSVSLLIEGVEAGGEIGELLEKIAVNIQENTILKKGDGSKCDHICHIFSFCDYWSLPFPFCPCISAIIHH